MLSGDGVEEPADLNFTLAASALAFTSLSQRDTLHRYRLAVWIRSTENLPECAAVPNPRTRIVRPLSAAFTRKIDHGPDDPRPTPTSRGDQQASGTLPQYRHHSDSVWRVLARFVDNASLPGKLDLGRRAWWGEDPQRVMAFAVWNTQPHAMTGLYQYVAVVADADRIADPDMRATMNYLADSVHGGSRLVALGGTTDEPEEWFPLYESCDEVTVPTAV